MKLEFNKLRPCLILPKKQKGLCHGIFQDSYIVQPSLMVGGHSGGVVANPVAIVEVEGGSLIRVNPIDIKFIENKFAEYDFGEDIEDGISEEDKLRNMFGDILKNLGKENKNDQT